MIERALCSVPEERRLSAGFHNDYNDPLFSDVPNIRELVMKTFISPMSCSSGVLDLTLLIPALVE